MKTTFYVLSEVIGPLAADLGYVRPATLDDVTDAMFRAGEEVLHGTMGPPDREEEYADLVGEILNAILDEHDAGPREATVRTMSEEDNWRQQAFDNRMRAEKAEAELARIRGAYEQLGTRMYVESLRRGPR